jgi:hypothetical protein
MARFWIPPPGERCRNTESAKHLNEIRTDSLRDRDAVTRRAGRGKSACPNQWEPWGSNPWGHPAADVSLAALETAQLKDSRYADTTLRRGMLLKALLGLVER